MRKESVQKFDLEAAFKALNTVEIPTVKGIRPNREDLQEKFTRKLVTDILVEDYYDVGDTGELEQAQEEREAEVAKAKLARIEKIVDLDAETEDDILPSYVGKFIMQCPQCMTLFYKNEEDIERSEEAPDVVNINEPCQHCGNSSGYTLVGKVDTVGEEEAAQYDVDDFEENELDLNFDEEEASAEEPAEAEEEVATEGEAEEDADLDLDLAPVEDEEEVQESLSLREEHEAASLNLDPAIARRFTKAQLDSLTPDELEILKNPKDRAAIDELIAKYNPKHTDESLTEDLDKDLDAKLKAHNDYIEYLKKMIEQEEKALDRADNEYVKKAIQRRLDAFKTDLEEALPDALKDEAISADELPTPEEVDMPAAAENKDEPKEKKESLTEAAEKVSIKKVDTLYSVVNTDRWGKEQQVFAGTKEECQKKLDSIKRNSPKSLADKFSIKQGAEVPVISKDESLTEATATVSRLKRKYSATELMVKELKSIEPFNKLSTRTIQRVLLPYYIENMGRDDLSTQALVDFFEYEGFAPYVLDHFMAMDPLARKELLKADAKFMQIFNDYAAAYNFFPGKDETLEPGESEFDYAFNIMFDIGEDGQARDTQPARDAIKALSKMYVAGEYDPSVSIEELTEDAAVDVLFDSEEFKTPISDAEIDKIRAQYEGLEEDIAPGVETELAINNIVDTWESVEDFDDETFNKLTEGYLTEVYSNVKSFKTTNCDLRDGKLIVEGTITFNSGKTKSTTFTYETNKVIDRTLVLEGLNADFASDKAFTLNCKIDTENRLIVESLNYKYTINNTLVEGLLK